MPSQILISEPHPSAPAGSYAHGGRGGAGNTYRVSSSASRAAAAASSSSVSAHPVKVQRSSKKFYSGIGGAGNVHAADERASLNLGEEFERAKVRDRAPTGHVGVGGAGNVYRKGTASTSSGGSVRSHDTSSSTAGFWGRISSSSSRH